jgi:hypothetical protein
MLRVRTFWSYKNQHVLIFQPSILAQVVTFWLVFIIIIIVIIIIIIIIIIMITL